MGVKKATISRYESGRVPDLITLEKIAELCGVAIEYLLRGEPSPQEPPRRRFSIRLPEPSEAQAIQATYAEKPAGLNIDYLARSMLLARDFSKTEKRPLSDRQQAELASLIYEYLCETHEPPGRFLIGRLADLIHKHED